MSQAEGKYSLKGTHKPSSSASSRKSKTHSSSSHSSSKSSKKPTPPKPFFSSFAFYAPLPAPLRVKAYLLALSTPSSEGAQQRLSLTIRHDAGITVTNAWTTAALLDSKVELANVAGVDGTKIDLQNLWNPSKSNSAAQKVTLAYKTPNLHTRTFLNYATASGNVDAVVDAVAGADGFLVGGEAGYDLQKAAITKYSVGLGYTTPQYTATVQGIQNLSVISASYYQKIGAQTEVGVKAGYDVQAAKASGLEVASKYKLDPATFAKAKINDRGIAALSYNTRLNPGTTLGLGLSLDTHKLNEAGHKIGTSLTFEG